MEDNTKDENIDLMDKSALNNSDEKSEKVDFDTLLSSAGELGRYQVCLFLATLPFYFYGVYAYFIQLFLTEVSPNHWCWIPELENLTDVERRNLAIPSAQDSRFGYSQCEAYVANWTDVLFSGIKPDSTWNTTKCQNGWEFNKTEIPYPTIASELGWVCDKKSYQATAQSLNFVGSIVGGFLIGWMSDRYGRLPATIASCLIGFIGGVATIFARNFTEFAICRFIMGMAYDSCMMMVYLLVLEYIAPKYRTIIANSSFAVFYCLASATLPWLALALGHWKTISLVTSIPFALAVFTPLIIPESPRWLLSKGRVDDAVKKVLNIGRVNKKRIPQNLIQQFKASAINTKEEENANILELLKRPKLRNTFICVCVVYLCASLLFDASIRTIDQLNFDFFTSFSLLSASELPSIILLILAMDWMGRRWLAATSLTFASIFCLLTVFVGGGLPSVLCALIARLFTNMACGTIIQWGAETMPTLVRGSGISIMHICGFIGTVLAPYIAYLEIFIYWLPFVVVAFISAFAAVIALMLPETANKEMPQTFDDAEALYENWKFLDMPCLSKKSTNDHPVYSKCETTPQI